MSNNSSGNDSGVDSPEGAMTFEPQQFPLEYRIIASIMHILIFVIGFFGNISVVIVVRRTKSMHSPTYCYLVSLAVADLLVVVSAIPEAIMSHHLYAGQWVLGHAGCSLLIFGNFLGINASSISIFCFTIERYIGICHPLRAQKICTNSRAIKIIIATWIFAVCYSVPWLGLAVTRDFEMQVPGYPDMEKCTFRLGRQHYVYFFMTDIVLFYVLPLLVSIALYIRIGLALKHSSRMKATVSLPKPSSMDLLSAQNGRGSPQLRYENKDYTRNIQVVRMLVIVVILFAVLWLPYRGLLVYNSFAIPWLNIWYLLFAKTLIYINCAINPVLYNAMSKRFRHAFLFHIFMRRRKSLEDSMETYRSVVSRSTIHAQSFRGMQNAKLPIEPDGPTKNCSQKSHGRGKSHSSLRVQGQTYDEQTVFLEPQEQLVN